jgi:hypothetical protein
MLLVALGIELEVTRGGELLDEALDQAIAGRRRE